GGVASCEDRVVRFPAPNPMTLATPLTRFYGRSSELVALTRFFEGGDRLVTLMGPAGSGKTRLAQRFGELGGAAVSGGVWFADLTDADDQNGVLAVIARVLDVPIAQARTADALAQLGRSMASRRRMLFILDNCEQVAQQVASVVEGWLRVALEVCF